ncbi:MAG: glutathione synthase, partial [Caulobacterales bacterium]|nr:glutathione synthase [Caulobacterales bacterium]
MTSLTLGVQMDAIDTIAVAGDTSFALMLEAQARGYEVAWFTPDDVIYENGAVSAHARTVRVHDRESDYYETLSEGRRDLRDFDVVLIRQDPPFD